MKTYIHTQNAASHKLRTLLTTCALVAGLFYTYQQLHAADADISDEPISSGTTADVLPNIMFTLDDSGSMDEEYMPDGAPSNSKISYYYSGCNTIYYDPTTSYVAPKMSDNTDFPDVVFTKAPDDGFSGINATSATAPALSSLSAAKCAVGSGSCANLTNQAYYYTYYGSDAVIQANGTYYTGAKTPSFCDNAIKTSSFPTSTSLLYNVLPPGCTATKATKSDGTGASASCSAPSANVTCVYDSASAKTGTSTTYKCYTANGDSLIVSSSNTNWVKTVLDGANATTTAQKNNVANEQQNFANWYSYYRSRLKMAKSSAGRALANLSDGYRVGFITINPGSTVSASKYLRIDNFGTSGSAQRTLWFNHLYSQSTNGSTPLRTALSRNGWIFAGQLGTGLTKGIPTTDDPVQFACQQNFTIMTTDGYWNQTGGQKLDGSTMDNEDGNLNITPRPQYDGAQASVTTKTRTDTYTLTSCDLSTTQQQNGITTLPSGCNVTKNYFYPYNVTGVACTNGNSCTIAGSTTLTGLTQSQSSTYSNEGASCNKSGTKYTCTGVPTFNCTVQTTVHNGGQWVVDNYRVDSTTQAMSGTTPIGNPVTQTTSSSTTTVSQMGDGTISIPNNNVCSPSGTYTAAMVPANTSAVPQGAPSTTISGGSSNSLSDVAAYYHLTDLRTTSLGNCQAQPDANGNRQDVCGEDIPSTDSKPVSTCTTTEAPTPSAAVSYEKQTMTTFTMGFGVFGSTNMMFDPNYLQKSDIIKYPDSTYAKLTNGDIDWTLPVTSNPSGDDVPNADDLWHAAIDGGGQAFVATNPDAVVSGLTQALSGVNARLASASAAATSNLQPVNGDNFAYTASYTTVDWTGDVQAKFIDLTTGAVGSTPIWTAQDQLDAKTGNACDDRTIYLYRAGATNNLTNFTWNTAVCDSDGTQSGTGLNSTEQGWFGISAVQLLSQASAMTDGSLDGGGNATPDQLTLAAGANLVNFLRGQRGLESFTSGVANQLYRSRKHILGDIVHSQPVYVSKDPFPDYKDAGHSDSQDPVTGIVTPGYRSQTSTRPPIVYVGANDGMLHAFSSGTASALTCSGDGGVEEWAFIPSFIAPNLPTLADSNYANKHRFYVDGAITVGDVCDSVDSTGKCAGNASNWHTILVSGTGKGGKGFFALDVSDPANPKALWEFAYTPGIACFNGSNGDQGGDCNLGYSFGNPQISKLSSSDPNYPGRWVVFVTSGYNNDNNNGTANDGQGFLYVLDAMTGKILKKIGTGVGGPGNPSNLGKLNNWVDDGLEDNTTLRVYSVDMLGNVWRFDVNGAAATGSKAILLATLKDPDGNPQPITTKPELTTVGSNKVPYVYVATGSYLGAGDVSNTQQQSIYALADNPAVETVPNAAAPAPTVLTGASNISTVLKHVELVNNTITNSTAPADMAVCQAADPSYQYGTQCTITYRTTQCDSNCDSTNGWMVNLPDGVDGSKTGFGSERVSTDMRLQLGTLIIGSNVPGSSACTVGGYSYLNYLDYATGEAPQNSEGGLAGIVLSSSVVVGINVIRLPDGTTVVIATTADAQQASKSPPISATGLTGRRVGWRVIQSD